MTPATRRACLKAVIADTPPKARSAKIALYRIDLELAKAHYDVWPNALVRLIILESLFSSWEKERAG